MEVCCTCLNLDETAPGQLIPYYRSFEAQDLCDSARRGCSFCRIVQFSLESFKHELKLDESEVDILVKKLSGGEILIDVKPNKQSLQSLQLHIFEAQGGSSKGTTCADR
jgi:hypothetical protein